MLVGELFTVGEEGTVTLAVYAQPGAGRSAVVGRHGDALKVRVAAPPEGGRANDALVKLLADEFGVPPAKVTLVAGDRSRSKRFRIEGLETEAFTKLLEQAVERAGDPGPGPGRESRDRNVRR